MDAKQAKLLVMIAGIVQDAIGSAGDMGAPGGVLYAALMAHGCTLQQFQGIMGGLERGGYVKKNGECYRNVKLLGTPKAA